MRTRALTATRPRQAGLKAFSTVEVLGGMLATSVLCATLYVGLAPLTGASAGRLAQENQRAARILDEKSRALRLHEWDQLLASVERPLEFTAPSFEAGPNGAPAFQYHGSITLAPVPNSSEKYRDELRLATIHLTWTNGSTTQSRRVETLVAKHGWHHHSTSKAPIPGAY